MFIVVFVCVTHVICIKSAEAHLIDRLIGTNIPKRAVKISGYTRLFANCLQNYEKFWICANNIVKKIKKMLCKRLRKRGLGNDNIDNHSVAPTLCHGEGGTICTAKIVNNYTKLLERRTDSDFILDNN